MNISLLRYVGIGAALVLAFVLFMNGNDDKYPYRIEIRSLAQETQLSTEIFVGLYRDYETTGSYDLKAMKDQMDRFQGFIERYGDLQDLPKEGVEDLEVLLEALEIQQQVHRDIYRSAEAGEPIPGEYALALREIVERRDLYQGRLGRY